MPSQTASKSRTPAEKPKRVREVYDTTEIPHLWAHQTQVHARNPQNNLYFHGPTIYSYRDSFPIARIVSRGKKRCVLLTTDTYSSTTGGHISAVRCAIPRDLPVFHVNDVHAYNDAKDAHARNWRDYLDRIENQAGTVTRARKYRDAELSRLRMLITEANNYSTFFGLRKRVTGGDDLEALTKEISARQAEILAAEKKAARARQAKRDAELAEDLALWLEGGETCSGRLYHLSKTYLRVVRLMKDEEGFAPGRIYEGEPNAIQTTMGATFPVSHAVKLWPFLKRLHDKGETYQRNGHSLHLGHYVIDRIDTSGNVTAGCHVVTWDEIERIAGLLGLTDTNEKGA